MSSSICKTCGKACTFHVTCDHVHAIHEKRKGEKCPLAKKNLYHVGIIILLSMG